MRKDAPTESGPPDYMGYFKKHLCPLQNQDF